LKAKWCIAGRRLRGTAAAPATGGASRLLVALALAASIVSGHLVAQEEVGIKRGAEAPTIVIEDLDGNEVDVSDVIGSKPVLLEFWATWCENCKALEPSLERAFRMYGEQVEFISVAVGVGQSQRSVRRYLEQHPVGHRVLFDKNGDAVRAYSAPTTSYVVVVNGVGQVAYTGVGRDQDLEAAVRHVLEMEGS
jgi:thiol-disulfide isomerase/thioredoxin